MVQKISADYIFPISQAAVKNGVVIIDDNGLVIENVLAPGDLDYSLSDVKVYEGFICPGFVNTHCHLELSYLKGKIDTQKGLSNFILQIENLKRQTGDEEKEQAICDAEVLMQKNGIVAVGDISNGNSTFGIKNKSKIFYHTFIETFASDPAKADKAFEKALSLFDEIKNNEHNNKASISPHATYSLSKKLFEKIRGFAVNTGNILSIHHQESEEENNFFIKKDSSLDQVHKSFGIEHSDFKCSGLRPLASIAEYLPKNNPLQLVHNTVSLEEDIDFANSVFKQLYWCFCPNANLYIEQRLPDFSLFFNKKCTITIGTDSYASNKTLSVLDELKTIRSNMPFIPLHDLLRWATLNGAEFLQISDKYGTIEKGKTPGLVLLKNINPQNVHITRNTEAEVI